MPLLTIKNEWKRQCRGSADDPDIRGAQLLGDNLSMKLETADATLLGKIRAVKTPENMFPASDEGWR